VRTRRTIGLVVFATALYVFHAQGLTSVIADVESHLEEGGALYAAARWRRKTPKTRDEISGAGIDIDAPPGPRPCL
jgi:hypothetical protein